MAGTGFEHTDFLQCCKFAEGDSRILMMKVARDRVRALAGAQRAAQPVPSGVSPREAGAAADLARVGGGCTAVELTA
jgi:acyl-CoA oxidase